MKNGDSSTCLACIVYNWEVNSRDDNKRLVMGKTFWPTSHSDFLSSNANLLAQIKTKIISHVYYYINLQLFSHKNIKPSFSCSGCFQPRAINFPFLVLVMQINCIFFWTLFVKTNLLWSKHFVEFIFLYKQSKVFYLNSQRNKNFIGQEKACNICPFQRFQYFPKV
jgi:hypothetical protein